MKKIIIVFLMLIFSSRISFAEEVINDDINNIFTNDPQTSTELQGYLQYDEIADETIYLEQQPESSQNTVYLKAPGESNKLKLKNPTHISSKSFVTPSSNQTQMSNFSRLDSASKFSTQEYRIDPVSSAYSIKKGSVSFGTTYNSGLYSAQSIYSTGIYTKYDDKHFSITTGFSKNTNRGYDSYSDRMFFAPELKLTKRLSLLDVAQSDMMQINKKNEVVLRYTPNFKKLADDIQFELGAGQSFYENNFINSSIRFSTRFKL